MSDDVYGGATGVKERVTMYEYLDLLERKLDDRQKKVCCRAENTVVAAGAGSGKTQVLATRFAWLVMSKCIPASKILTLTFTNKAAGEMYERIYNTLSFFAQNEKTPPAERKRAQDALDAFGETHIQTLDSYCAALVRQAANRYGIRPDFTAGSADTERGIKDAALPFVLQHRNNPAIQSFADAGKLQGFAENTLAATVNKYTSIADSDRVFTEKLAAQRERVEADFRWFVSGEGTKPAELDAAVSLEEAYDNLKAALEENTKQSDYVSQVENICEQLQCVRDSSSGEAVLRAVSEAEPNEEWSAVSAELRIARPPLAAGTPKVLEKISKLVNSLPKSGYTVPLRAAIKILHENSLPYLDALMSYIRQYDDLAALFALFDEFHAQIKRTKRISGRLSFRDIQKMALKMLREQDDLREQEYAAYEKIMIDEFQDNNGENRDLLFLLSSPASAGAHPTARDIDADKLFFVGDEKQSIYKFRGADVAVFNELQRDFTAHFGEESVLPMEYNYRSNNALITSFNRLFGGENGIFDQKATAEYEATYPKEKETKKYAPATKTPLPSENLTAENVNMHFCVLNKQHFKENDALSVEERLDFLDEKEQVAYFIAKKIEEITPAHYNDIAILDKSRTDRGILIKWLNAFGIPYRVDQNTSIFASGLVFDIYNFLRLCVYPTDRNACAAYLTSPLAGLSENAVETMLAEENDDETSPLAMSVQHDNVALSERNLTRFQKAQAFFLEQQKRVLSQPLTDTLEMLWNETGYRYETLLTKRAELSGEQFDMLYELARQCDAGGNGVAWFVDQLAILRHNEESAFSDDADLDVQELTYPVEKDDAVQILTIHKSKGLQYKHVFVYGCFSPHIKSDTSAVFFDERYGVTIRPQKGSENYFVLLQKELAKKKERAEFRRLLYVAITRAETDVYVTGAITPPSSGGRSTSDNEEKIDLKLLEKQLETYYPEWSEDLAFALTAPAYSKGAPFAFSQIMPAERTVLNEIQREKTAAEVRTELIATLKPQYATATALVTEREKPARTTPSALETSGGETLPAHKPDPYAASVNKIVEKYASSERSRSDPDSAAEVENAGILREANFSYADFGTLAHACLEALAHGKSPADFTPETKQYKNLTEAEQRTILAAARTMAENFAKSPLGMALKKAQAAEKWVKAEYAFRTMMEIGGTAGEPVGNVLEETGATGEMTSATATKMLVTGAIDLIFENAETSGKTPAYTLVDYKTDQSICPAMYYAQQKCYRTAAARLLGCDERAIRCWLYYLRFGEEIEITQNLL